MTVAELIEELSKVPQDATVITWDTWEDQPSDADGVAYDSDANTVEIV